MSDPVHSFIKIAFEVSRLAGALLAANVLSKRQQEQAEQERYLGKCLEAAIRQRELLVIDGLPPIHAENTADLRHWRQRVCVEIDALLAAVTEEVEVARTALPAPPANAGIHQFTRYNATVAAAIDAEIDQLARYNAAVRGADRASQIAKQKRDFALEGLHRLCERIDMTLAVSANHQEDTFPALLSAPDLARRLGLPVSRVDSALRRFHKRHLDCRIEVDNRRMTEPKYLYRTADVLPVLEGRPKGG